MRYVPALDKDTHSRLPSSTTQLTGILGQALQCYPGVQVGTNVHVSDLAYADDIVLVSINYREIQGLFDAVNR